MQPQAEAAYAFARLAQNELSCRKVPNEDADENDGQEEDDPAIIKQPDEQQCLVRPDHMAPGNHRSPPK